MTATARKMNNGARIALTGFMGVGKSSVARHLAHLVKGRRVDLDHVIESREGRRIVDIIDSDGIDSYREIETRHLDRVLTEPSTQILSLGGGTWTVEKNRELLKASEYTSVWLEATFEHCWMNISHSKKDRPLARNKQAALKLFNERQKVYCLADWHVIIRPDYTSYDVAAKIAEEIFS
jgi:shikimate kinase